MHWLPFVLPVIVGLLVIFGVADEELGPGIVMGLLAAVIVAWIQAAVGGAISAFIPVTVTPVHENTSAIVWLADLSLRSDVEGSSVLGSGSIHGGDGYGYNYPIGPNRFRHGYLSGEENDVQIVTDRKEGAYLAKFTKSDYKVCRDIPGWQHDWLRHLVPWDADCTYSWFSPHLATTEWYEFHVPPNAIGRYYSLQ